MIALCTHCWAEIDDALNVCSSCGEDLNSDPRTYEQKLVAALEHPLPGARVRICWLIGENKIQPAVPDLMKIAECDPDLFVRRAALEALAVLRDPRAVPLLEAISKSGNHFLAAVARRSLGTVSSPTGKDSPEPKDPFCPAR
jgi:HEAT repeat protein